LTCLISSRNETMICKTENQCGFKLVVRSGADVQRSRKLDRRGQDLWQNLDKVVSCQLQEIGAGFRFYALRFLRNSTVVDTILGAITKRAAGGNTG